MLIGYPLDKEPNLTIRKNDLDLYEAVTTSNGPAMTWSMFCVGHLELGSVDLAAKMFNRQLLQSTQPFQVVAMSSVADTLTRDIRRDVSLMAAEGVE